MSEPRLPDTPPLELDPIARRLGIAELARKHGRLELPSTKATSLDLPQRRIVGEVRSQLKQTLDGYAERLDELNRRILGLDVTWRVRAMKQAPVELSRQLRNLARRTELGRAHAAENHDAIRAEYAAFRTRHQLTREPRHASSILVTLGLLLAIGIAKAALFAYALADRAGIEILLGSVGLVFVELAVLYLLGRSVVRLRVPGHRHKLVGLAAIVWFLAVATGVNLFVAHLYEGLSTSGIAAAGARLLLQPLALVDTSSAMIAAAGLALSVSALAIGALADDRHPDYGQIHRKLMQARGELDYWSDAALDGASGLRERQLAAIDASERQIPGDVEALERSVRSKAELLDEIRTSAQHAENVANALLAMYRDINLEFRETAAPKHFERRWKLPLPDALVDRIDDDLKRLDEARRSSGRLAEMAHDARAEVGSVYTECVGRSGEKVVVAALHSRVGELEEPLD